MNHERYELKTDLEVSIFRFVSNGRNGKIPKLVIFQQTATENVYNLAFGDENVETGDIDDEVITNNGDSQKVLATVASTIYSFTHKYPKAIVAATGSNKARTRLYRMGISNHLEEIAKDFNVFGLKDNIWLPFEKNTEYEAFFIKRKKRKK